MIKLVVNLISLAEVTADHLTITYHIKRAYALFLMRWMDGFAAPLPRRLQQDDPPFQLLFLGDSTYPLLHCLLLAWHSSCRDE